MTSFTSIHNFWTIKIVYRPNWERKICACYLQLINWRLYLSCYFTWNNFPTSIVQCSYNVRLDIITSEFQSTHNGTWMYNGSNTVYRNHYRWTPTITLDTLRPTLHNVHVLVNWFHAVPLERLFRIQYGIQDN